MYEDPFNLIKEMENGKTQPTEDITFTPLTDNQIDALYARVGKKNKKPNFQNPVPASYDNNLSLHFS